MNPITMELVADKYIRLALEEDISCEDVTTNAVMPEAKAGEVDLICKQDGIVAGLKIFERVFQILDPATRVEFDVKDGERVTAGQHMATVKGDIRVLLSGRKPIFCKCFSCESRYFCGRIKLNLKKQGGPFT